MTNFNLKTKLKITKTFIRGLRTKINNKKQKDWNWQIYRKEDKDALSLREREKKKGKKETAAGKKLTIIRWHPLPYKKEDTLAHLMTRRKGKFGHQIGSQDPSNTADDTYSLARERDAPTPFSNNCFST